ncbi:hypothetical protein [Sediminibacterium ginsengisoli]|nr:hypothetical protein [Sediminibacterium ginsengisoli]
MNTRTTSFFKCLTAMVLLLLFTGIHLVKSFHHHCSKSWQSECFSTLAGQQNKQGCSICQFHFAKDGNTVPEIFVIDFPVAFCDTFVSFIPAVVPSNEEANIVLRGPPGLI